MAVKNCFYCQLSEEICRCARESLLSVVSGIDDDEKGKAKIPIDANIVTLVDRTGSMCGFIRSLNSAIPSICKPIEKDVASMSISIQTHGDRDYKEWEVLLCRSVDIDTASKVVSRIELGGGGDPEETHLDALNEALNTIPFKHSKSAKNFILMIINAESKLPQEGTPESIGKRILDHGYHLIVVGHDTPNIRLLIDSTSPNSYFIPISDAKMRENDFDDVCTAIRKSIYASLKD